MEEESDIIQQIETQVEETEVVRKGRGFKSHTEPDSTGKLLVDRIESTGDKAEKSIEGWTLVATNVHREASEEDVLDFFSEFGAVKSIHLNLDRNDGYVKGYALLEYEQFEQAKRAVTEANDAELMGQKLTVDFAFLKYDQRSVSYRLEPKMDTREPINSRLGRRRESRDDRDGNDDNRRDYRSRRRDRDDRRGRRRDLDNPDNSDDDGDRRYYRDRDSKRDYGRSHNRDRSYSPRR